MMTAIHFTKFIIKVLLFIVLIPFLILWFYVRYRIFRHVLIKNMVESNMPKDFAKSLAHEMSIKWMWKNEV